MAEELFKSLHPFESLARETCLLNELFKGLRV